MYFSGAIIANRRNPFRDGKRAKARFRRNPKFLLQIYRGIYESFTLTLPPPLPPFPSRPATDRPTARRSALLPANGGRAGEPRGVVGAGPGVAAAAGAAVALAPAAARLAVARGPQAPAGAHVPGGVRAAAAPAPRALPRRPRRHRRRAPGAALRHGPRRVRLQGQSGGTPPHAVAPRSLHIPLPIPMDGSMDG